MLKASALYIVIIMALVIAVLCSALIMAAYFYQSAYQTKFRSDRLQNNIRSGIHILLTSRDSAYQQGQTLSLFNNSEDSVMLKRSPWGVFDIALVQAFVRQDTTYKVFSIANTIDSGRWAALYLIDEDRPLSLSGKTMIRGDAYIPKAGVKIAYVDNQSYTGDKRLVTGRTHDSDRKLPPLAEKRLQLLHELGGQAGGQNSTLLKNKRTDRSFRLPTGIVSLGRRVTTLQNISLSGNIIIYSDTTLIIDSSAILNNIIIFAKAISVKSGFHGTCQLYASDSIGIARNCHLAYPSCLGVMRYTSTMIGFPEKISLGENSTFGGLVFTYEKLRNPLPPMINMGKNTTLSGQIYSQGTVSLKSGAIIRGSVMTTRFLYQSEFTAYENYLINATIDAPALSRYYLTSELAPAAREQKKILQWLEVK
jgi:hypothetical protein